MTDSAPIRDEAGRWQSGASGNPAGRPRRGAALAELLRAKMAAEVTLSSGEKTTVGQAVANRLVALALQGDVAALRLLFERAEGRVPLAIDFLGANDELQIIRLPLAPPPTDDPVPQEDGQ